MDGEPEILASGPDREPRRPGWWPGMRHRRTAVGVLLLILAAALAAAGYLGGQVGHRDAAISTLRSALLAARAAEATAVASPSFPVYANSTLSRFPDKLGGSFSLVAAAVRPRPGLAPLTWLFVYGQHAAPGQRYALLGDTCTGQFVTSTDLATGTANSRGELSLVAPNLDISPRDPGAWITVYRMSDGLTLGGVEGPFVGGGARGFRSVPPC